MSREYKSSLAGFLSSYVNYRQRGGLSFKSQERILASFDAYLAERRHSGPLSPETIDAFLDSRTESLCIGGRWRFRQVVSQFYDYLGVYYTGQRRLPKGEARVFRQRPAPRIFTEEELAAMLNAAKHISRHNKIRNMTFHAALAVAIACGLRAGEVVRIHIEDIDFQTSRLTVRKTKFGKSRIIPIGSDLLATLGEYLAYRRSDYPGIISDHLFVTMHKSSLSQSWFYQSFRELLHNLGMAGAHGKGPHPHDLRHTFAVRCLTSWHRRGLDPQTLLPHLATYMGHTHYSDTAYYLTMTMELLGYASDSIEKVWKEVTSHEQEI